MTEKKVKPRTKAGTSNIAAEDKRKAFVDAFLSNGGNATQAATQAGFSPKTAGRAGNRMLKDVRVRTELDKRRTEIVREMHLNTERLFQEIARLALSDPRRIMHPDGRIKMPHELDDDTAAAIASFEVSIDGGIKYKFWDKNSAQERAAKIVGAFERDNEQKNGDAAAFLLAINNRIVGVSE